MSGRNVWARKILGINPNFSRKKAKGEKSAEVLSIARRYTPPFRGVSSAEVEEDAAKLTFGASLNCQGGKSGATPRPVERLQRKFVSAVINTASSTISSENPSVRSLSISCFRIDAGLRLSLRAKSSNASSDIDKSAT